MPRPVAGASTRGPAAGADPLLSVLLDAGGLAVAELTPDGCYLRVNDLLAAAHGVPPEQHLGLRVRDLAPDVADVAEAAIAHVLTTGEPLLGVELVLPDRSRWSAGWHPVPDPVGGTVGSVVLVATPRSDAGRDSLRGTAMTLQRSLLPAQLPCSEELEVAARYVAGAADSDVGGDWYDVIALGAGRLAVVIGDVMGRGVPAAAVMGQLRTAARTCARLDLRPGEVLDVLDALLRDLDPDSIATCVYAAFDPHTRELRLASAGHLPPLVLSADGEVHRLQLDVSGPLGVGDAARESSAHLHPGSLLALYTDGLVERRGDDLDDGIARLGAAVAAAPAPLEELADHVMAAMTRDGADDVALLLLRVPRDVDARSHTVVLEVPRERALMFDVRSQARLAMRSWMLLDEVVDTATLIASELATNALVHGRGRVELRLRLTRDRLVLESVDTGHHMPRRRRAGDDEEGGRGLHLVASLADRWGFRAIDEGKVVWAELDLA